MKLNWQKTILATAVILGGAIITAAYSPAISQARGSSYMIASGGGQFVWRVNVATGAVSYCVRKDSSVDAKFIAKRPPFCSAQSPAAR